VIACTVGTLMGDAWMCLPALVDLSRKHEVALVCGSYALPVWEWGIRHAIGADYRIARVIPDPDEVDAEFCPGKGFLSIDKALKMVREQMPQETVLGHDEIGSVYQFEAGNPRYRKVALPPLELRDVEVCDGEAVVVHPYTRHDWKNCDMVIDRATFRRTVKVVGLAGEFARAGWEFVEGFDAMVAEALKSAGVVGVLSLFTNLAAIFHKKQIIVSFTEDIPIGNPRAVKLVRPSLGDLQAAVGVLGF
jgi:hypothetical protein